MELKNNKKHLLPFNGTEEQQKHLLPFNGTEEKQKTPYTIQWN
jgi:hypothetical protein